MTKNKKEIVTIPNGARNVKIEPMPGTPEAMIVKALDKGITVDVIEKLVALKERIDATEAKRQFNDAMANFQGECPTIKKKKDGGKTNAGVVAYKYAPLEVIVEQVKELIQKHGFSYSIKTEMTKERVKVTCVVKHTGGHSEESTMDVPMGTKTHVMSEPQVVAATTTFAKRYAFVNAFGIMTGDDDVDGKPEGQTYATEKEMEKLKAIIGNSDAKGIKKSIEGVKKSEKYTDEQKEQILEWMDERMQDLPDGEPVK